MSYVKQLFLDDNGEVDLFHDSNALEEQLQQEVASWFNIANNEEEETDE